VVNLVESLAAKPLVRSKYTAAGHRIELYCPDINRPNTNFPFEWKIFVLAGCGLATAGIENRIFAGLPTT
jgi:hypothetical protein